jgi:hypothetical protein
MELPWCRKCQRLHAACVLFTLALGQVVQPNQVFLNISTHGSTVNSARLPHGLNCWPPQHCEYNIMLCGSTCVGSNKQGREQPRAQQKQQQQQQSQQQQHQQQQQQQKEPSRSTLNSTFNSCARRKWTFNEMGDGEAWEGGTMAASRPTTAAGPHLQQPGVGGACTSVNQPGGTQLRYFFC